MTMKKPNLKYFSTIIRKYSATIWNWLKKRKPTTNTLIQLAMLIIALFAMYQTNITIQESRESNKESKESSKEQINLTIKMKDAVQQSNALLDSMKKSIGGINSSMWDARNIINQIPPQVENISENLSSVNSLIAEQKRRAEEELNKKAKLILQINEMTTSIETEPYRQKIKLEDFYIHNLDSVYTQVHLLKIMIPDSLDFQAMHMDFEIHDKEKRVKEVLFKFDGTSITPLGFIYTYIDFEFVNPLHEFTIEYLIFHSQAADKGSITIPYMPYKEN